MGAWVDRDGVGAYGASSAWPSFVSVWRCSAKTATTPLSAET